MEIIGFITGIIFFIILEGFFAGSEIALLSADKNRLKAIVKKNKSSYIKSFLDHPEEYITLTMLGYTLSIVFAATLYTLALIRLSHYFPSLKGFETLMAESLVIFTIIFGEIIPKSVFHHYADKIIVPSLFILSKLRIPVKPLLYLSKLISRIISRKLFKESSYSIRREDILDLLREESTLKEYESMLVSNIISFKTRRVGEIVKPLYEIVMIAENANVKQAIEKIKRSGYSRIPVYRVRVDDIVGYVSAYDLIGRDKNEPIRNVLRPILFISEFTPLPEVIKLFKEKREHIAVVVDERGVILGIVTLEDILKEIIGNILDEKTREDTTIKEIGPNKWKVEGRLEINELVRTTGVKIPEGSYSTVGGFITYMLGRIPKRGEELTYKNYRFKVLDSDGRKVKKVIVEKL